MTRFRSFHVSRPFQVLSVLTICSAIFLVPIIALSQSTPDKEDKAIAARQGYMKLVGWESEPLFGMAKGDIEYDADMAKTNAANLKALAQYSMGQFFLPGTSSVDRPKSRTLPAAWTDRPTMGKAHRQWITAIDGVVDAAGKGQSELATAVGELGKSCGVCHKPFRADDS